MLESIHHIAIICSDYEASKTFYVDKLGLEILSETYRKDRDSYKLDLSLNGRYVIELFSFPDPPERLTRPEAAGLRHLAFTVADLDQTVKELKQKASLPNRFAPIPEQASAIRSSPIRTACL